MRLEIVISADVDLIIPFHNNLFLQTLALYLIKDKTTKVEKKNEINKNSINIIPNPIDNILKIDFKNKRVNNIEIIDINGNSIYKEDISIDKTNIIINTSTFPSGVYLLRLISIDEIETYKFVK